MFGLRSDGKKLKNIDPIIKLTPHIMPKRYDAMVNNLLEINCADMDKFITEQFEKGIKINYMHIVIASIVRMYSERPKLNRFVMNGRIFRRNNIQISFTIKKKLVDTAGETTTKLTFTGHESIYDVKEMIDKTVKENVGEKVNGTDKTAKILLKIPNSFLKFTVGLLKLFDKHGLLPKKLLNVSPFHTSCFLTNMKSISTDYVYHHLYEFGTTGLFVAMGKESMQPIVNEENEIVPAKIMKIGLTIDERIADGLYNAHSIKTAKKYMSNPYLLEERLEKVLEDPDK